uniref:Uncharacterized protein n=1 Tax=Anopheles stephensi TaxID=30069 RepID=A0A182YEI9_ANOST
MEKRVLENSYHGLIKENETFVEITPLIKVDETKICGFHIIKKNKEIPFQEPSSSGNQKVATEVATAAAGPHATAMEPCRRASVQF